MSFSKPETQTKNPAKGDLTWIGSRKKEGGFKIYSKEQGQREVGFDQLEMVVLDSSRRSITGYTKKLVSKTGQPGVNIWSNEMDQWSVGDKPFKVAAFDKDRTVIADGIWKEIKNQATGFDAKFTYMIYVALFYDGEFHPYIFKCAGGSLYPWSDFEKANKDSFTSHFIKATGYTEESNGDTDYKSPLFGLGAPLTDDQITQLIEMDTELQKYFQAYDERKGQLAEEADGVIAGHEEHAGEVATEKVWDTTNWMNFKIPHTDQALGNLDEAGLIEAKESKEIAHDCDDELYANLCAGLQWHQLQAANSQSQPQTNADGRIEVAAEPVAEAPKPNPFAKPEPAAKPNPFAKAAEPELDWANMVIVENGSRIGDMEKEEVQACLDYCNGADGAAFLKYKPALELAAKHLDQIPF